jgi:hypothetical protein
MEEMEVDTDVHHEWSRHAMDMYENEYYEAHGQDFYHERDLLGEDDGMDFQEMHGESL